MSEVKDDEPQEIARLGTWGLRVAALVPIGLGIVAILGALAYPIGAPAKPGPGMWPLVCGIALLLAGVLALLRDGSGAGTEHFGIESLTVLIGFASLVAFTILLPLVGFEIPLAGLLLFWTLIIGKLGWVKSVATALLGTAAFYAVFVVALQVPLPRIIQL